MRDYSQMNIEDVAEFPFVEAMPARQLSRWQRFWQQYRVFKDLVKRHGDLVPQVYAAKLGGVSVQRIDQLCLAGNLVRVYWDGHAFITEDSFVAWAKSERRPGTRYDDLTKRQVWKMSTEASREILGK